MFFCWCAFWKIHSQMKTKMIEFVNEWIVYSRPVSFVRHFLRFLKRLKFWIPVLWNDEDWDSAYLFIMMQLKISRIRECVYSNKRHEGWERDVRNMKIAEELLARLSGDSEYKYYHRSEFCTCPTDNPFSDKYLIPSDRGRSTWNFPHCRHCLKGFGIKQQARKEKLDAEYLWDLMRKHSKRWWD